MWVYLLATVGGGACAGLTYDKLFLEELQVLACLQPPGIRAPVRVLFVRACMCVCVCVCVCVCHLFSLSTHMDV